MSGRGVAHRAPGVRARAGLAAVLVVACALLAPAVRAQAPPTGDAADDSAIRSLWSALDDDWNGRDAAGFSELFAVPASMEFIDRGQRLEGRAAIHRHFAERFAQFAPELRHRTRLRRIEGVAPDVRIADGTVEILRSAGDDGAAPVRLKTFAIFAVMHRAAGGWTIRALRIVELTNADAARPASG